MSEEERMEKRHCGGSDLSSCCDGCCEEAARLSSEIESMRRVVEAAKETARLILGWHDGLILRRCIPTWAEERLRALASLPAPQEKKP